MPSPTQPFGLGFPSPALRKRGFETPLFGPSPALRERVPSPDRNPGKAGEGNGPPGSALGGLQPFLRDRLRPLVGDELAAALTLLGADRSRILAELGPHRHRLLDRRPLRHLVEPALDVGELLNVDLAVGPARRP